MIKKLIVIAALFVANACSDNAPHHNETQAKDEQSAKPDTRVTANAATTQGISKMKILIRDFQADPAKADFATLQAQLDSEFNTILQKCTMKGADHDQLHHFLVPVQEMIKGISHHDTTYAGDQVAKLSRHLETYDSIFR